VSAFVVSMYVVFTPLLAAALLRARPDRLTLGYEHPMGRLRTTDIVGLDVRLAIAEHLARELGDGSNHRRSCATRWRLGTSAARLGRASSTGDPPLNRGGASPGVRVGSRTVRAQEGHMTTHPTAAATGSRAVVDGFFANQSFDYGIRIVLGATAYGVGDAGTVLATAARIADGDWASWFSAWTERADQFAALGAQHREVGDLRGASWAFLTAADAWSRALDAVDGLPADRAEAVLLPTFRKGRDCWEALIDCSDSRFVRVEVPYEGTTLLGYLLRPDASGRARPTLVMTNGSDGPITAMWWAGAAEALDRGWNAFVYDGPGQQSMLFERGTTFRPDWEAVLTPVVDALVGRPDVDAAALTAYGISQPGY
jgi:3-hydroxyacyl-CoA dehydrogenase, C-terminal domain